MFRESYWRFLKRRLRGKLRAVFLRPDERRLAININRALDFAIVLWEDVSYREAGGDLDSELVPLLHPSESRLVGVKIWNASRHFRLRG